MPRKRRHNTDPNMWKPGLLMTKAHLKHLRGLKEFARCWSVIDSHLKLYEYHEGLSMALDLARERAEAKEEP